MRIICILAGGSGNRFGSPVPKQYHLINGRPVIEYVIDAALKSVADEVIVVSDTERMEELEGKYGVITIQGGRNRNRSIDNALDYIKDHFECDQIILVDAVCPTVQTDLFDLYFDYLSEYDAVFTVSEVTTGLSRKDLEPVDRREYLLIESPDAYRFEVLQGCFNNPDSRFTTPLHVLPKDARIKYYYDFKDYLKIMYPHDLAVAEALMKERERHIRFESHANDTVLALFAKLRKLKREETKKWEKYLDADVERLFAKWDIYEFSVNQDAYTGLVLECKSRKHGNVVLKMYPPFLSRRFVKESFIISHLKDYPQATLIDIDEKRNAILLSRVIPGDYIVYEEDKEEIADMFRGMYANRVPVVEQENIPDEIRGIVEQTKDEYHIARQFNYRPKQMEYLVRIAERIYEKNFASEPKYVLHGDAYYKNALRAEKGIRVIDPVGYVDAFVFEYMPFLTYELVMHARPEDYSIEYDNLKRFFHSFTDTEQFDAATFIFLVKQLVPSVYEANDEYKRANRFFNLLKALFLDEHDQLRCEKISGLQEG